MGEKYCNMIWICDYLPPINLWNLPMNYDYSFEKYLHDTAYSLLQEEQKRKDNYYKTSNVLEGVKKKFEEREKMGISKYGTTMDRNDLKDAEWLTHAQEEAMDLVLYLERLIKARKENG